MIYINGCSFTYGDELLDKTKAWPYLLAKKMQTPMFNDSISGGTNHRILYRTIKNLQDPYNFYLIAWTSNTRYTFYKADNNFEVHFDPKLKNNQYSQEKFYQIWGQNLYRYWHNELYATKLWLQQILQLQAMFEKNKKKYLMINTFPNNLSIWLESKDKFINSVKHLINFDLMTDDQIFEEYEEIQYYTKCIDQKTFYKWNEFDIISLCEKFPVGSRGHLLEAGHQYLANLLFEYIDV